MIWAATEDSKSSCTFINLEFEVNQLQELRKPQDEPLVPVEPSDPLCLCKLVIVKQVYSGVPQSQGWIYTLLLEVVQKEKAWHVLTDSESGAATSAECSRRFHLHLWGRANLAAVLSSREPPSNHDGIYGLQPPCHWVSERYQRWHEVIWSPSSLFKNGALPHQSLLRGLVIIEGAAEGAR